MATQLHCAKIGCPEKGTYYRPLCKKHWQAFDRLYIFECEQCHRFDELVGEFSDEDLCPDCYRGLDVPVYPHGPVEHRVRYLYVLKLDGGQFYVGQTDDLEVRLAQHRDGSTSFTAGKHPKLVWFERWEGRTKELNAEEAALTLMANDRPWAIRRLVVEWQRPLRLVDLDA